ncbi:Hypothetical predicted protein [Lecanosticta acicola]|uniref:Impact N-terminal domain-containing protein n=1 Tax=Lecanosticta acicola TaxID=111012 RepID=A0AAI8Z3T1_9PEZI|nr:Hypothetical predicted protein [Lecanosticta acicola]
MSAANLQTLLRFLSQDAKLPLATAMGKVKELQSANLDSAEALSKAKPGDIKPMFEDEKICKQIISAAKRVSKKRAAGDESVGPSPKKKKSKGSGSLFSDEPSAAADLEESLKLPESMADEDELAETALFTNRAPLVLAFLVILLKHTMPEQPLSSRLSLAQGYVSITSRSRAIYLGIESGKNAEDEGFGEGQSTVTVAGKDIKVLKRWGYEWKDPNDETIKASPEEESPALWALDLEAMRKSGVEKQPAATRTATHSGLPIYTPQSARAYLLKSFDTAPTDDPASKKKPTATMKAAEKEWNLAKLLRALELLYESWAKTLSLAELDKRTWTWYVKVRPAVEDGVAGWGGKNQLKLADILALRSYD